MVQKFEGGKVGGGGGGVIITSLTPWQRTLCIQ